MRKKYILLALVSIFAVACAPKMKSQRVSLDRADELASQITDEWIAKDTELAVKDLLKQIENHRGFQRYLAQLGKKPKIFISEVQNQTSEAYFPIGDLNDELLNEFSYSGDYILIDAAARDKILKEIRYQNDGMVDERQVKSIGKASGADLLIFGDIRMKPESLGGKTVKDYSVNLRMTDIESGEEVLRVRYKASKYSERKKIGW
jgi:PBP1b-binding outer membrane lipoprotein LpoB